MNINFHFHGVAEPIIPPIPPVGGFAVAFLPGGGFTIGIPPNAGFSLTLTPAGANAAAPPAAEEENAGGAEEEENAGGADEEENAGGAEEEENAGGADEEENAGGADEEENAGGADEEENAGGAAVAVAVGGGGGVDPNLITEGILQHAINTRLSASQVLHLLIFDHGQALPLQEIIQRRRRNGVYMYPTARRLTRDGHRYIVHDRSIQTLMLGDVAVDVCYRRSITEHPDGNLLRVIVARRYYLTNGHPDRFIVHYLAEDADDAAEDENEPGIPVLPVIDLGHLG